MKNTLYDDFHDPSQDFGREPRAFCYNLATQLIADAKKLSVEDWYEETNTTKGLLLLLFTRNFAARETKKLNFENVGKVMKEVKKDMQLLKNETIMTANDDVWPCVGRINIRIILRISRAV